MPGRRRFGPSMTQDLIRGNTVSGSGADGIQVSSDGNTIRNNQATGDNVLAAGWFDLRDTNPTWGGNTWRNNKYRAAVFSPACAGPQGPG